MTISEILALLERALPILLTTGVGIGGVMIWASTHENSGIRGLITYIFHVLMAVAVWLLWKWIGLLLFFIPLLILYYYFLIHLALIVVPASDPGDWKERFQRVRYFFWYTWGFQYPGWAVANPTARVAETRIKGDQYGPLTAPGLVWAHPHQVVGLTAGISFSRIVAPGTVFTKASERPIEGIVDLRMQLRTFWVDVVSSDGIPYKALLFTTFVVDKEKWDRKILHRLYLENRLLKDAREPDYTEGSFPFSRLRIRTLLSATGIRSSIVETATKEQTKKNPAKKDQPNKIPANVDQVNKDPANKVLANKDQVKKDQSKPETTYWDQMVMYHVEKAAGEVLSQKRFDELWLPADDHAGASAADDIAQAIRNQCFFNLLCRGVRFLSCRLVNFQFTHEKLPEPGEVERQQIATWQADWQRDALQIRAGGKAEAELVQQEARALAYATLLTAIAEGLQETHKYQHDFPRNLVVMRFIGAMDEILQRQPEGDKKNEATKVINTWKLTLSPDSPHE